MVGFKKYHLCIHETLNQKVTVCARFHLQMHSSLSHFLFPSFSVCFSPLSPVTGNSPRVL